MKREKKVLIACIIFLFTMYFGFGMYIVCKAGTITYQDSTCSIEMSRG